MLQIALTAAATFFVTVMPLKAAPFFAALTNGWTAADRRRAAIKAIAVSTFVLLVFGLGGDDVLRLFGISLPALRVGGGILLLLASISIISGPSTPGTGAADHHTPGASAETPDIAVFPMAMPVIAGPATITAVLVLVSAQPSDVLAQAVVLSMLLLVLALTLVLLLMAPWLERVIGITVLGVVSRIAGILLAALAAEMILQGIGESGAFHLKGR